MGSPLNAGHYTPSWYDYFDATTGFIGKGVKNYFSEKKNVEIQKYPSQTKSSLYGLGAVLWLQGTVGNPWLSKSTGLFLSLLGSVPTTALSLGHYKDHFKRVMELPLKKRTLAFAAPILLGVLDYSVASAYQMYSQKNKEEENSFLTLSAQIWATYGIYISTITIQTILVEVENQSKMRSVNPEKPIEMSTDTNSIKNEVEEQSKEFIREIKVLKKQIKQIDNFILKHKELKEISFKVLKDHQFIFSNYKPPSTETLDPQDPTDRWTLLGLKRNALKRELKERMAFIKENPEVLASFEKHMEIYSSSDKKLSLPSIE